MFGAVSGAHFNPAVSVVFALRRELLPGDAILYIVAQIAGGIAIGSWGWGHLTDIAGVEIALLVSAGLKVTSTQ